MNLFLIGYRGTGKTTIGKSIAAGLGWSFVDSDVLVVQQSGMSIQDMVAAEGWQAFRHLEHAAIKKVCTKDRQVVATGGGVVLAPDSVRSMAASGIVVWLWASAATIYQRLIQDKNSPGLRPPLTGKDPRQEIQDMLSQRNPYYENAGDFCIRTDALTVDEIARKIIARVKDSLGG